MTLKIYGIGASRAARPLWTALELGVPFEHMATPYAGGATRTPEFLAINPNGHIPVVVDERPEGTVTVWESMACALYIARVHGQADGQSITPATPREEAEALRWSFWTVFELEKDALTVLMHRVAMPADQRKPELADQAESRLKVPLAVLEAHLQAQKAKVKRIWPPNASRWPMCVWPVWWAGCARRLPCWRSTRPCQAGWRLVWPARPRRKLEA
jgi:glutathione S-transferase